MRTEGILMGKRLGKLRSRGSGTESTQPREDS
jgi:hypothetical protein